MSNYGKLVGVAMLITWLMFIVFADQNVVDIVTGGIAGWTIGGWMVELCYRWFPKEKE